MKWACLLSPILALALNYDVQFVGMDDSLCLKALKAASDLVGLKDRPPASVNGLRYRVESDIPGLMKVLRAFAYYDAQITYEINANLVTIFVHSGPPYKLASYQVFHGACTEQLGDFAPQEDLGKPAWSATIVNAELQVLTELSRCGYPLAVVDKRKVEVDLGKKQVNAAVCVQEGPYSKFGPSLFFGLENIKPRYIERRIAWKEGQEYDSDLLHKTQERILKTDLFSSVYISHGEAVDEMGELPMQIRFTESKHRQFSIGGYWATQEGPGATIFWTHRNLRGMGEVINFEADLSEKYLAGQLQYKKPDFLGTPDQSYRALGGLSRERIHPYLAFTWRFANYIERKIDSQHTFSAGLKLEHILVQDSATNGTYFILGLPLFMKYDRSDNVLDPHTGYTLVYSATPYQSMIHSNQHFVKQRLTTTWYFPLHSNVVFALRSQFGSIAGAEREDVPLPKLFLGGTEDELRGYRYMSVSPIKKGTHKSLGGRGAIYGSAELRFRVWDIGIVPFFDVGTVTNTIYPEFNAKWFKSVGLGLRYFAFFGPIRADIGFPLNPRKHIDRAFQAYASVGQAF